MDGINRMSVAEFRKLGYLQELNRQFLHPLGLALEIIVDDATGEESLGGIWDYRDDPDGIRYESVDSEKASAVLQAQKLHEPARRLALGYVVQPVGEGRRWARGAGCDPEIIGYRMAAVAREALHRQYNKLLLEVLAASVKKVKAGLKHVGSDQVQSYPPGIIELGVALDAIDMVAADIKQFVAACGPAVDEDGQGR